ncbi:tudor domain-containing protein 5 [Melitaea cinxia]|uniref:tudor domain-containing protein 5 n=1 Tax=Melitaea cinxia TaxID=113334 RepID=UPI001E27160E|nr:tudor domain-containing protein 5 [Melitaea cinxia]
MEEEIKQLKSVLRSLVVSSPTQVDVRSLCRDYRNMVGKQIPNVKFGFTDTATFLREKFSDCFVFQGSAMNPVLTLIVPDSLKHIDKFVQKQRTPTSAKLKGKRKSVPESVAKPVQTDLIVKSFKAKSAQKEQIKAESVDTLTVNSKNSKPVQTSESEKSENEMSVSNGYCSQRTLRNFLERRTALQSQTSLKSLSVSEKSSSGKDSTSKDDDSGRQTSSSMSSGQKSQLEQLKQELRDIILSHPDGVWCADILRIYRERYGRELVFPRFGYSSVLGLVFAVPDVGVSRQALGDWLLYDARALPALAAAPAPAPAPAPRPSAPDPEDALPGIAFDPDVFPEDCMHFMDSIPSESLVDIEPGTMLEVVVAEVYSPSHFWLLRLGESYNIAMEDMMDEMNEYYTKGEGANRTLALGAVRVGQYCASCYEGDWHRSLIVKVVDSDTVKVRHVDYGTVERAAAAALRPLARRWAALPAQALRARLAAARPPAAGRRWPRAAAAAFLRLVRERRLVANVVAADPRDGALEVLLIDTSGARDRCLAAELVRAGHADARPDSALATSECYLYPRFEALENGDTPNFAEIHAYLRDGIALECVDDYRRHVPPCLPDAPATPSPSPPPPPPSPPPSPPRPPTTAPSFPPVGPTLEPSPPAAPAWDAGTPTSPTAPGWGAGTPTPLAAPAWGAGMPTPPAPVPLPFATPMPGVAGAWDTRTVTLSAQECETYALLSVLQPVAAHRFMLAALSRALAPHPAMDSLAPRPAQDSLAPRPAQDSLAPRPALDPLAPRPTLDPLAPEFKMAPRGRPDIRPPPGFELDDRRLH